MNSLMTNEQFYGFAKEYEFSIALTNSFRNNLNEGRIFIPLVIDLIGFDSISHKSTQQKIQVLKKFAAILNFSIRAEDQVYKCGVNRFFILLANTEGTSISTTIEKIVNRIDSSIAASDLLTQLNISCRLGHDHIAMMDKFEGLLLPQEQILSSNNIQKLIDAVYTSTCKKQQQVFRRLRDIELLAIAHVA